MLNSPDSTTSQAARSTPEPQHLNIEFSLFIPHCDQPLSSIDNLVTNSTDKMGDPEGFDHLTWSNVSLICLLKHILEDTEDDELKDSPPLSPDTESSLSPFASPLPSPLQDMSNSSTSSQMEIEGNNPVCHFLCIQN